MSAVIRATFKGLVLSLSQDSTDKPRRSTVNRSGDTVAPPYMLTAVAGAVGCCTCGKVFPLHPPAGASRLQASLVRVNQEYWK